MKSCPHPRPALRGSQQTRTSPRLKGVDRDESRAAAVRPRDGGRADRDGRRGQGPGLRSFTEALARRAGPALPPYVDAGSWLGDRSLGHYGYHCQMMPAKGRKLRLPLWVFLCVAIPAHAAQVSSVQVTREGSHFLIDMHLRINASPPAVFRALQDYAAMARYNPDLRAVRVEKTASPDRVRLFTTVHTCVLIFCKTMHEEQMMTATANAVGGALHAQLISGDFKRGYGLWVVQPCPTARATSCMDVRIELVPAFWVPPVIGPWVIRSKMDEEARRTGAGLERTAGRFIHRPRV